MEELGNTAILSKKAGPRLSRTQTFDATASMGDVVAWARRAGEEEGYVLDGLRVTPAQK